MSLGVALLCSTLDTHILIADAQHKVFALVEYLSDSRPVIMGHGRFVAQHNNTARSEAQVVLHTVLALIIVIVGRRK